jgi:hypothetical protein
MQQQQIDWRRAKVLELSSQGYSQIEIATNLQIDKSIISRDLAYLRQQAQDNLKMHIQDKLPEEYQNCMVGINQVIKICWDIVNKSRNTNDDDNGHQTVTMTDNKTILQALALINDCNKYKMDLTTNGVVITDAIKFVQTNKEKLSTMSRKEDNGNKISEEPDYDQLEEKQEEETGEKATTIQLSDLKLNEITQLRGLRSRTIATMCHLYIYKLIKLCSELN